MLMKIKYLLIGIALLVLALALAACAGPAGTEGSTGPTQASGLTQSPDTQASTSGKVPATQTLTPTEATVMTEVPKETIVETEEVSATASGINCMGAKSGDSISMVYPWSGPEEEKFKDIMKPLVDACGIVLKPESTHDEALLDTQVKAGTPPDIVFSKVSRLAQYKDLLKPLTNLSVHAENYAGYWKEIGSVDGRWLGLPVRVDVGTIIWFSPENFEKFGYQVPTTVNAFLSQVDKMASDGHVPFSMGFESGDSTGMIGAEFIETILLVEDGPDYVDFIIDGNIPYNSSGVKNAYLVYGKWATDANYTVGGAEGTLTTNIDDAIDRVFSNPPEAMMVRQPASAGRVIAAQYPEFKFGVDYDFFQASGARGLHGSTDWMMAFSDSAAVKALVAYLSSEQGGEMWAQAGFGNTPNNAGTNAYTDERLKKLAQILADTQTFVPDIEEAIPGGFANAERQGIVEFINGGDLDTILDNLAAIQMQALGK
jgi:alpha-glucoside transport system substrate-binding protein